MSGRAEDAAARSPGSDAIWWLTAAISTLVFVLWLAGQTAVALDMGTYFDGYPADGPFQVWNQLRRIAAGQVPGRDFVVFHGVLGPYMHYPVFAWLGGSLSASEVARGVLGPWTFALSTMLFFSALSRKIGASLVLTALTIPITQLFAPDFMGELTESTIGYRSFMPLVVGAAAIWLSPGTALRARVIVCSLISIAILIGTEQGVALMVAYVVGRVLLTSGLREKIVEGLLSVTLPALLVVLVLLFVSSGDLSATAEIARYNLVTVPGDQFWYFGAPPNPFVDSLAGLRPSAFLGPLLWIVATIALLIVFSRRPPLQRSLESFLVLTLYSLLSLSAYLGIAIGRAGEPAIRVVVVLSLALVFVFRHQPMVVLRLAGAWLSAFAAFHLLVLPRQWPVPWAIALAACGLAVFVGAERSRWLSTRGIGLQSVARHAAAGAAILLLLAYGVIFRVDQRAMMISDNARAFDRNSIRYGPLWKSFISDVSELGLVPNCSADSRDRIWSTYAGLLEGMHNCFHPDSDYVIHALGEQRRRAYVAAFIEHDPDVVQTMRRSFFGYEDWLRSTAWPFYEQLIRRYQPTVITQHSVLWKHREETDPGPSMRLGFWTRDLDYASSYSVHIAPHSDFVIVDIRYRVSGALSGVPIIGSLPRYLIHIEGALNTTSISLDPTMRTRSFPLLIGAEAPRLIFRTASLVPGAAWAPEAIRVTQVDTPNSAPWRRALFDLPAEP